MSTHVVPEVYTVDELAQELRMERRDILAAIRRGEIPAIKVGKTIRVAQADVTRLRRYSPHGNNARRNLRGGPA